MLKVIGVIVVLAGLVLPGMMVGRAERYQNARSFFKWLLWFVLGIGIAGLGYYLFTLGNQ